ncbi:MAG TPA: YdeI/OmpD-associated family protein [Nitrososphaerales archaeon]|nr:YdeI/OmpD-associated family protein [Nitrososphaerales archaeon]
MSRWNFKTTLVRPEGVGTWTFAPIPVDLAKQTGIRARLRVKGTIDAVPFKGTLLPSGSGRHFVVVKKDIRDKIGKNAGDVVKVEFDLDASPVKMSITRDFASAMASTPRAKAEFEAMAPSHKKAYVIWIESAKGQETGDRRIAKAVAMISTKKRL